MKNKSFSIRIVHFILDKRCLALKIPKLMPLTALSVSLQSLTTRGTMS